MIKLLPADKEICQAMEEWKFSDFSQLKKVNLNKFTKKELLKLIEKAMGMESWVEVMIENINYRIIPDWDYDLCIELWDKESEKDISFRKIKNLKKRDIVELMNKNFR